jgi:hypothetical protein
MTIAPLHLPRARTAHQRARALLAVNIAFPLLIALLVAGASDFGADHANEAVRVVLAMLAR